MTVKELIAKLSKLPQNLPVYVESAPWGAPYEAEIVRRTSIEEGKRIIPAVMVEHNVGM